MNATTGNPPHQPTVATSLETLYRTYSTRLAGLTAEHLGTSHPDLVDDALQEVWLQAAERAAAGELPDGDGAFDDLRKLAVAAAARHTLHRPESPVGMLLDDEAFDALRRDSPVCVLLSAGRGLPSQLKPPRANPPAARRPAAAAA